MCSQSLEKPTENIMNIELRIIQAAKSIPPVWPLKTAIACNPLLYLEEWNFWDAVKIAENLYLKDSQKKSLTNFINCQMIKWTQSFLDEGIAKIQMPGRENGFYQAWKSLANYDDELIESKEDEKLLSSLPTSASKAVEFVLQNLPIPEAQVDTFLSEEISKLPGWAGYVRYRSEWNQMSYHISLTEFLAVRLGIFLIASKKKRLNDTHNITFYKSNHLIKNELMEKQEKKFAMYFLDRIIQSSTCSRKEKQPHAQWVFCIDVRSESFRHELEKTGNYETFGFAGFFGLPISVVDHDRGCYAACPVIIKPLWNVAKSETNITPIKNALQQIKSFGNLLYRELKYNFGTPFALAETIGVFSAFWMGIKSLAPQFSYRLKTLFLPSQNCETNALNVIPLKDQVTIAELSLRLIGITDFAPVVILCGHGSTSQNNPFASSLDCGACGGNKGGLNSKILASILNSRPVREELSKKGVTIPHHSCFIGAEHNTTTDEITFFDEAVNGNLDLSGLKKNAKLAGKANRLKRGLLLGEKKENYDNDIFRRSSDWSEVRPEWGLAKNAAFLIAPRSLSKHIDLNGRSFLHSYDWKSDRNGSYLETILTGPLVVAQWINSQYLFSTLNPTLYGSGSKTTQNIVGTFGVMQGNGSDLMHGLPLQSVFISDSQPYHEPIRLLTVILASCSTIDMIVNRQPILQKLIYNAWINLIAIDPETNFIFRLDSKGKWTSFREKNETL